MDKVNRVRLRRGAVELLHVHNVTNVAPGPRLATFCMTVVHNVTNVAPGPRLATFCMTVVHNAPRVGWDPGVGYAMHPRKTTTSQPHHLQGRC
jgi:hypothetical protein